MASVADLRGKTNRIRDNLEALKGQLQNLELAEPSDDLSVEIQRQAALSTARALLVERAAELQSMEAEAAAAEAAEVREKQLAHLRKRAAKAAERFNDSIMAVTSALAELNAINSESIGLGAGAVFLGVGAVRVPPRVVPSAAGRSYCMGSI